MASVSFWKSTGNNMKIFKITTFIAIGAFFISSTSAEPCTTTSVTEGPTCDQYVVCEVDQEPVTKSCPNGMVWYSSLGDCTIYFSENNQCGTRTGPVKSNPDTVCEYKETHSRVSGDCRKFKVCSNGAEVSEQTCAYPLVFHPNKGCVWTDDYDNAECRTQLQVPDLDCSREVDQGCFGALSTRQASTQFCNDYFVCNFGRARWLTCPTDQLYNAYTNECEDAELVDSADACAPGSTTRE